VSLTGQSSGWAFVLNEPTRVLLADDDRVLCEFGAVHLSSPVAVIETAPDGEAAWSMLTRGDFDIAVLDIDMPRLDGFSLLDRIRADAKLKHLPVMMLTYLEDIASIDRAYTLGADAFSTKPVNWRLLSYQIRYVLRASRAERRLDERAAISQPA
jgi:DNA-binding response OmpR family regulator